MARLLWSTTALALLAACTNETPPAPEQQTERSAASFQVTLPKFEPDDAKIIGGKAAKQVDWPATRVLDSGDALCTATIVGPRAVLTAAHCIEDGATGTMTVGAAPVSLTCSHHPTFAKDTNYDVALCAAGSDLKESGLIYETLDTDAAKVKKGVSVTILGYGCTKPDGSGSGGLFFGSTPINTEASAAVPKYTLVGPVMACSGDSGGGGFVTDAAGKSRRLVGVMEAVHQPTKSTFQVAVSHNAILSFLQNWSTQKKLGICGINGYAGTDCRKT